MKSLIDLCAAEIAKCDALLQPLYEKYGCDNSFNLLHSETLSDIDREEFLEYVYRKDAYVTLVNKVLAMYQAPFVFEDTDLDAKRRCIFSTAGVVLDRVSDKNFAQLVRMDGIPTTTHVEHALQCIIAGDLEAATFGLMYALYQKHFQKTNRADIKIQDPFAQLQPPPNQ
jgi:hypothetical protein